MQNLKDHFFRLFGDGMIEEIDRPRGFHRPEGTIWTPEARPGRPVQMQEQQQQTSLMPGVMGNRAVAFVDSDAVTPVYRRQRGFASTAITRIGAGDYTLTLLADQAIDTAAGGDVLAWLTINHTAFAFGVIELASATTLRIRTATGTAVPAIAAADLDYWCGVSEFGPN